MLNITSLLFLFYLNMTLAYKPIFNCDVQKLLINNPYVNHIVTFTCFLYLVILADNTLTIADIWLESIRLYILFIMLTKTTLLFVSLVILLIVVDQTLTSYITDENKDTFTKIKKYIKYSIIMIILIGFVDYFFKQKKEHPNFSYLTLFFSSDCENAKKEILIK